jgi:hypothetical protein
LRIRLSDTDREALGGPEWLEFDSLTFMTDEAEAVEDAFGIFAGEWYQLLRAGAKIPTRMWRAIVWLSLRRAGVTVEPAEVRFDVLRMLTGPSADEVDEGKGESTPPAASAASKPATASRSRRSSASGRGKSTG